ncbi:hypothetical protein [Burkholderia pseudomallei]|uniref:hypothetical protein n=1 Tax=Burkholderia pseudomallei TaxID=28450 RepID=UPI000F4F5CE8|nr:hypothetical protein [Burkholderia pseudomallei]
MTTYKAIAVACAVIGIGSALLVSKFPTQQGVLGATTVAAGLMSIWNYFFTKRSTADQGVEDEEIVESESVLMPAQGEQEAAETFAVNAAADLQAQSQLMEKLRSVKEDAVEVALEAIEPINLQVNAEAASHEMSAYLTDIRVAAGEPHALRGASRKKKFTGAQSGARFMKSAYKHREKFTAAGSHSQVSVDEPELRHSVI